MAVEHIDLTRIAGGIMGLRVVYGLAPAWQRWFMAVLSFALAMVLNWMVGAR